ncbi:MAG: GGDEF domain-containing protein, partial [Rhizobiaceae bacterium]|nr:GGDEF domain-containing protein [Rhizobiaceae bacterium]
MDPRPDPSTDGSVDAGSFARGGEAETIARLTAVIAEQAHAFEAQALAFARSQSIFKRASAAARLGLWECDLSDQSLTWSDGVYDLFDIPRDETLDREAMLDLYTPESLSLLEVLRAKAIEKLTGFTLDAKIVSLQGRRRWIRITATV